MSVRKADAQSEGVAQASTAACLGAGLLAVSLLLYGLIALGGEPPEWVVVMAAGVYTTPLLVPFLHVAYCRRVLMSAK